MKIAVASGKGGTGKTTIATNMALSLENVQLLDCDVEEPNAHIFLKPEIKKRIPVCIPVPKVDETKCDYCGKCAEFCEFNAIAVFNKQILIFPELCHGCGGCLLVCPKNAIAEECRNIGVVKKGVARDIEFVYGELNIGEPMAVPVIRKVKEEIDGNKTVIIDASPGTSCPMIAAVHGSDYCILVTEPTPFGLHDLRLAVETIREMKIPFGVIINCEGIGDQKVQEYCKKEGIPLLLKIPMDRRIAELYSRGTPFVLEMPDWKNKFSGLFDAVQVHAQLRDGGI
ncbi:MAG: ATP-binding protein [Methanocellales archaeon]|nr:ATP-binding protein [Methanocellales archaeon]MDD3291246.1 ATP-binding protein [Methanocellales archaeon]MDD5235418.1 ATP-binding protein [Methanocellales archaeon]MDD5484499.1 ATP-binding protein [Methanocellales archaeon]